MSIVVSFTDLTNHVVGVPQIAPAFGVELRPVDVNRPGFAGGRLV